MEIQGTPQNLTGAGHVVGGHAKQSAPAPRSKVDNEKVKIPGAEKAERVVSDDERMAALRNGILRAKESFAVRDTSISLFKDAKGQVITRVTSLRDGSVSYYPEPEVVKRLADVGIKLDPVTVNA